LYFESVKTQTHGSEGLGVADGKEESLLEVHGDTVDQPHGLDYRSAWNELTPPRALGVGEEEIRW
jgi:hypothetical protein